MYLPILGLDEPLGSRANKEALSALYGEDVSGRVVFAQPLERETDIKHGRRIIQLDLNVTGEHDLLKSAVLNIVYCVRYCCHPLRGWSLFVY